MTVGLLHAKQQRDFVADLNEEARAVRTEVVEAGSFADGTGNGNHLLPRLSLRRRAGSFGRPPAE